MIGSANAAVLPVPVWALPRRSRPCEGEEDGLALDGRRLSIAYALQHLADRRGEAEVEKACQLLALSRGRAWPTAPTTMSAHRAASCLETPRVSWVVGYTSRGAQQEDDQGIARFIRPSRGWSAANRSWSGMGLSHAAVHKSNFNVDVCRFREFRSTQLRNDATASKSGNWRTKSPRFAADP